MNEETFKPTLKKATPQGARFEKNFKQTMNASNVKLNETDGLLSEVEQSLKKKIFSLAKMEALVFSDPKLKAKYEEMAENGEEKYGYHYNETIQNMLFNDYVLNSPLYLQKYKQAIPQVEKKRRDASGINQLKKAGEKKMQHKLDIQKPKPAAGIDLKSPVDEAGEELTKVQFLVNERDPKSPDVFAYFPEINHDLQGKYKTAYSHVGQHSAVVPSYAAESRPATPEEAAPLKAELESIGYKLEIIEPQTNETTGAGSSGSFSAPLGMVRREIGETTTSASSGAYVGPAVWGSGDLMHTKGKSKVKTQPMIKGGTIIAESNYLTETDGFEKYVEELGNNDDVMTLELDAEEPQGEKSAPVNKNEVIHQGVKKTYPNNDGAAQGIGKVPVGVWNEIKIGGGDTGNRKATDNKIIDKTTAFTSDTVKGWNNDDAATELDTIETGDPDKVNLETMEETNKMSETDQSMIDDSQQSMSNKAMPLGGQGGGNVPTGTQQTSGAMNESDIRLLEELNNELNAYSIHHNKLKKMTEDKKTSSLIMKDRLGDENKSNFKKDMQHSGTKEIIDVEKELQWKDQQTDVGDDPQKLSQDIEKTELKVTDGQALKNVGDSANDKGDEIPKRNFTKDEQDEVDMYRLGQHSLVYDNEPGKRFEDRMKADMGDKIYDMRQKQLEFRGKAPMYNKVAQPVQDTKAERSEFDKEKSGWNDREGLKESMITGRYLDGLNKRRLIEFTLNEVLVTNKINESLFEVDFTGLGNTYNSKTTNNKVTVNETVVNAMSEHKFFTDGKKIFAVKNPVQSLNENEQKVKPVINEQFEKMKHLSGYKPNNFISTKGIKL